MWSHPKNTAPSNSLVDLDDPLQGTYEIHGAGGSGDRGAGGSGDDEHSPDTARPGYEPATFARHVESAKERMTSPPAATYEMLRDSCKSQLAEEIPLDEEQILRPSSRKQKVTPRAR